MDERQLKPNLSHSHGAGIATPGAAAGSSHQTNQAAMGPLCWLGRAAGAGCLDWEEPTKGNAG